MIWNKRWLSILALLTPMALSSQDEPASLRGIVADLQTSEGIPGASVLLTGIVDNKAVRLTTKTTAGGQFRFEKVAPSDGYWILVDHGDQHVQAVYPPRGVNGTGKPIPVSAGEQIQDIRIGMVATGEISGRVLDSGGKPMSDAQVSAMVRCYTQGVDQLGGNRGFGFVRTNRRGEYRISGLPPGPTYLYVIIQNIGGNWDLVPLTLGGVLERTPQFESSGYPPLYYPGTADEHAAEVIYLKAGERKSNVDVVVKKVNTRRVNGSLIDAQSGAAVLSAQLVLIQQGWMPGYPPYRTLSTSNGRFDLRGVLPGTYYLITAKTGGPPRLTGRIAIEVDEKNVEGLVIPLNEDVNLSGRVTLEGSLGTATPNPSRVAVMLTPTPPATPGPAHFPVSWREIFTLPPVYSESVNGLLDFRGIPSWDYAINISHPFEDSYVKTIRLGGLALPSSRMTINGPVGGELEVVLGAPAGRIEGQVLDSARNPAGALNVVLIPEQRERRDLYRQVWTDDQGNFQMKNLPPGDFQVFAWEDVDNEMWFDRDFLVLYEGQGVPVRIAEGSRISLKVQAIPRWF